jgi:hypothetical protein
LSIMVRCVQRGGSASGRTDLDQLQRIIASFRPARSSDLLVVRVMLGQFWFQMPHFPQIDYFCVNYLGRKLRSAGTHPAGLHEGNRNNSACPGSRDQRQIAWNDFIVVGPRSDPADTRRRRDAVAALQAIAAARVPFVSRGDKSGTDALEHRLWRVAAIDPLKADGGSWYRDIGGGMGAALNIAQATGAYTMSDRGTWLSFRNKGDLAVLVEGDPRLVNRYNVILLNPEKHPVPKQAAARRFAQWLLSPEGQAAIGAYKVQLFHLSAADPK